VTPLLLAGSGVFALVAGLLLVRSFGQAGRIGRIVAGTRPVPIATALALVEAGDPPPFLRVDGRIDATDEFEDAAHRPLVLRLTRLEVQRDGRWQTVDERREAVSFGVRDGPDAIGIDADRLDEGLAVLPRESRGTVADLAAAGVVPVPEGLPPTAPVRFTIRQVSSVEHAAVLGVPSRGPDGSVRLGPGRGRPLILTTLETDEAIRMLGGGRRVRSGLVLVLFGVGLAAVLLAIAWSIVAAVAG
jgi:hypothetical protein